MHTEKWIKWSPPIGTLAPVYLGAETIDLVNRLEIFLIGVKNISENIKVVFGPTVYSYRSTDESSFCATAKRIIELNKGPYYGEWAIFKVVDSTYIQWLIEESEGQINCEGIMHFLIRTENTYIEIISTCEPEIEYV